MKKLSLADRLRNEMQVETGPAMSDLWDEEPVPLDVFVQDKGYLGNPPLFDFQYAAVREVEQIFFTETYISMVEEFGSYWTPRPIKNFIYAEVGKGGGKDHFCRIGSARVAYLLSCLKSPQAYYGFAPQDEIHTLNVASTSGQARRAFFKPFGSLLRNSPWFKSHIRSEITDLATSIRLTKQLEMVSGHSLAESFEGLNPILAIADEIASFASEQEKALKGLRDSTRSAEAILKVLRSSARSRFPQTFKLCAISYPRYLGDPIETLMARARKDIEAKGEEASRYFAIGPLATWQANPRTTGPEDFQEDYDEDPEKAKATYECLPQRSSKRFFRNDVAIEVAFPKRLDERQPVELEYWWGTSEPVAANAYMERGGRSVPTYSWQVRHILSSELWPRQGCIYALHADLAVSGDRAGIAMSHVRTWNREADEERQQNDLPIVKVDFVTSYEADLTATLPGSTEITAREVQLRWFRQLVRELIEAGFIIGLVTLDGWQSTDTIQILETWGIEAKVQSIDRTALPYQTLRDVLYDGRLEAYDDGVIVTELEGLTKLANGKIDHPADGSKDEADALCGSVLGALVLGGDEGEDPERNDFAGVVNLEVGGFGEFGAESMDLGLSQDWADIGTNSW